MNDDQTPLAGVSTESGDLASLAQSKSGAPAPNTQSKSGAPAPLAQSKSGDPAPSAQPTDTDTGADTGADTGSASTAVAGTAASGVAASDGEASALDTGLMCYLMLCQFLEVPADGEQIRHKLGKPGEMFSDVDLLRVAKDMDFKARMIESDWERLDKTPLPAIAKRNDGTYFILAKVSKAENKVLIQCPLAGRPETKTAEQFSEMWDGTLMLMTTREQISGDARQFDISWFIPAVIKYRRLFSEVILASFFIQIFATVSPLFFMVIIDKVLVSRGLSSLDVLIFALVVVSAFEVIMGGMRTYIFSHTTNRIDVELGTKLFKHLLQLPISYFGARRIGETVARVRELENIRNFLTGSALTLVVDLVFTIVFFWIMFLFAPVLTWIVMGSIPVYVGFSLIITPALRARVEEKFQRGAANTAFLTEAISGVETLKASAVEPQMQRRWEEQLAGYVQASFKTSQLSNIAQQGVQAIQKITMAATLFFGAKLVIDGDLTVGQLVAFNMLSGRVSQPILRLAQLWQDFQQMRVSVERLGDILNTKTEGSADAGRAKLPPIKGDVEFDGITFRYRDDGPEILRNISLKVPAGQVIGIVGPSGSGKSTLTKLVQRLYLPEKGRVLIDGTDLGLVDPAWLRRQVGVVLQENFLFNRSVRDNIAIADPAMTMERVIEAATQAGAHDFILELPEGYDTLIGERGGTLSGGQRQRIAIARALVTNPRILILDEATSALDYESEEIIQRNMRHICKGRTVFTIAHRLSTVRDCDRIITIEAGEVVEDGTHTSLLNTNGRYSKLWQAQALGTPLADQLPGISEITGPEPTSAPGPTPKALVAPKLAAPEVDVPKQDVPKQDVPEQDVPEQDVPEQADPKQDVPVQKAPDPDIPDPNKPSPNKPGSGKPVSGKPNQTKPEPVKSTPEKAPAVKQAPVPPAPVPQASVPQAPVSQAPVSQAPVSQAPAPQAQREPTPEKPAPIKVTEVPKPAVATAAATVTTVTNVRTDPVPDVGVTKQAGAVTHQAAPASNQAEPDTKQAGPVSNQIAPVIKQAGTVSEQAGPVTNQIAPVTKQTKQTAPKKKSLVRGNLADALKAKARKDHH